MSITHLDAERRVRKQFSGLSDPQEFARMLMDNRREFDKQQEVRAHVAAFARRHTPTEPPSAA